jgi:3D (Asp-Asp-Asp) domain-containing protein
MKLFFGGGAAFAATLLAASVLFYAKPLFAESPASQQPTSTQQEQKDKTKPDGADSAQVETRQALETAISIETASVPAETVNKTATTVDKSGTLSGIVSPETASAAPPAPAEAINAPQAYVATAYSLTGKTASGMRVAKGVIAADPRVLPLGSRVRLEAGPYSGEYVVADIGSAVRGRKIDVWVPSYREACRFGRRNIKLSVLSYGKKRAARAARAGKRP